MKLPPFALDRFLDGREHATHNLAGSVCNQRTVANILELEPGQQDALLVLPVEYQPYRGRTPLREEIAATYSAPITLDNTLVTMGAQEGIFALLNVLLQTDDHVVVQTPCYQLLNQVSLSLNCKVDAWYMNDNSEWDLNELELLVTDKTRLMVINSPHNPTSVHFSHEEYNTIIAIARQNGCYLLSDEVYRYLEIDSVNTLPAAAEVYERAISISDMSKTYGLPGARTAWLVSQDTTLLEKVLQFKDYTTITGNAVGQFLAEIAVRNREAILSENRVLLQNNIELLSAFAERQSERIFVNIPAASTTAFIRFVDGTNAETLAIDAFNNHDILIAPGNKFGDYPSWARIGFGDKSFPTALVAFEAYFDSTK